MVDVNAGLSLTSMIDFLVTIVVFLLFGEPIDFGFPHSLQRFVLCITSGSLVVGVGFENAGCG